MKLAKFLNSLFTKNGFILIDANGNKFKIGNPVKENPITLKILDKSLHFKLLYHPDLINLYPCGEGAGYAGGIISAALDGFRVAHSIGEQL